MRAFAVVEPYPVIDGPLGLETVIDFVQIDCLLLQRSPEPLNEDVVQIAAPPIHRNFDIGLRECLDLIRARVLATLIRIHDLGLAIFGDGFVQCFNAKAGIQRI